MTTAFWAQLVVAGLLVFLVMVGVAGALLVRQVFDDAPALAPALAPAGSLPSVGLPLGLAAWLTVAAFGLRRGSRVAYWLSLAGLAFPLLGVVAGGLLEIGTSHAVASSVSFGSGASTLATGTLLWNLLTGVAGAIALVLVVATIGMLRTRAARRFFAGSALPGSFHRPPR